MIDYGYSHDKEFALTVARKHGKRVWQAEYPKAKKGQYQRGTGYFICKTRTEARDAAGADAKLVEVKL